MLNLLSHGYNRSLTVTRLAVELLVADSGGSVLTDVIVNC
jgi:hypothetical protein